MYKKSYSQIMHEHLHIKRHLILLLLIVVCRGYLSAEVAVNLSSGQTIVGDILFENEEVVVIRTGDGMRYQYPRQDILSIGEAEVQKEDTESRNTAERKVGVGVQVVGGAAFLPQESVGGFVGTDLKIGACNLMQRHIFLGGSVGYRAFIVDGKHIGFIPLQVCAEIPFLLYRNAPYIGMGVGYGIAVNKSYKGGLFVNLEIGWRHQINPNSALTIACYSEYQQGIFTTSETINEEIYTQQSYLGLSTIGLKLGIRF